MWKNAEKYHLHIELTSKCNSKCPHCPRFIKGTTLLNPNISLAELKINEIKEWFSYEFIQKIGSINFCGNFGDPTNCTDMINIVEYFHLNNPNTKIQIRTNGGARNTSFWKELGELSAKSNYMIEVVFSVDGLEDTNHLYRRDVGWNKLKENILAYTNTNGYGSWEFLIFKHNEHQIDIAKEMCTEFGLGHINFKQPIGFEDYFNNKKVPMPVYNKLGELDYIIEPSLLHSNSKLKYDGNTESIPKNILLTLDDTNNSVNYDLYKNVENTEIKCKSVHWNNDIEIYLNYKGELRTCCHIGVEVDRNLKADYGVQLSNIFKYDCNLRTNSMDNILEFFDKAIEGTWGLKHEEGRCIKCSLNCGKSSEVDYNRLYTNNVSNKKNLI
jgi:MoaA/NifB/PqqE/SkfB family radical SAM enzyme